MKTHPTPGPAALSAATSDTELAQRAAAGDTPAFEAIMRRHNQLLFRTARSILKSDVETEDVLQEAYLLAWRAIGDFRAEAKLSTWLVRIVINQAFARLRRRSAQIIPLDTAMEPIDPERLSRDDGIYGWTTGDGLRTPCGRFPGWCRRIRRPGRTRGDDGSQGPPGRRTPDARWVDLDQRRYRQPTHPTQLR